MRMKDPKTGRFTKVETESAKRRAEILSDVKGMPVLGYTIYWSLSQTKVEEPELEQLLGATIGTKYMPRKPIKKRVLRRALKELKHLEDAGLITKVRDDAAMVGYIITEEVINDAEELGESLDFQKRTVVVYEKDNDRLRFGKTLNTHAQALMDLYKEFTDVFTSEDIRKIILEWVRDQSGITLRESGGIYFVPCETSALDTLLTTVGGTLYTLPMLDCGTAKKQMYAIVKFEIESKFEILAEEIKHLAAKGKTSELVFKRRLEEFKELRMKTEAYRDLLLVDADVIGDKITSLEAEVRESIVGIVEDYETDTGVAYGAHVVWDSSEKIIYSDAEIAEAEDNDTELPKVKKVPVPGTVVGYSKHKKGFVYVKIKLDSTGRIQHVSPKTLTLIEESKAS